MKHSRTRRSKERRREPGRLLHLVEEACHRSGEVLDALNSIPVTAEDLWCIGRDLGTLLGSRSLEEGFSDLDVLAAVKRRFGDAEVEKGSAVLFRFEALVSMLAGEEDLQLDDALFSTAAVEPIVQIGNELTFQRESFLRRVRGLAAREGTTSGQ